MLDLFQMHVKSLGLPIPEKEYRFAPPRRWRADYFFANGVSGKPLACEVEGGLYIRGRHTRGAGFLKDCEKYNMLSIMGISLLRFTPSQVKDGTAALTVKKWFEARE